MRLLISVCCRQIIEVITIPKTDNEISILGRDKEKIGVRGINLRRPYTPNFSSTPARIMEPAIGASTWALGSQRCIRNIGSLAKNAAINDNVVRSG